ncbi:uncharacterized protein PAC_01282 [Phialocephala subalpina]|uniref:Apple domain-containing protein n=1 Tax=Phialocephala subalpina TaxID=576137 RepID=A0A1L7WF44_9HELO|nr:uncharacterized protein PAC_01282 [Phialocephala subalpina]
MALRVFRIIFLLLGAADFSSQSPLNLLSTTALSPPLTITKPTLQQPITTFPTSTTVPSFATETSLAGRAIYYKTSPSSCNIEGSASLSLLSRIFPTVQNTTTDILGCQSQCRFTTACQSYSFNTSSSSGNCVMYMADTSGVVKGKGTGVFFSMKFPGDGSDFCYDDVPITDLSVTSWLYPYPARNALSTPVALQERAAETTSPILYIKNASDCNIQGSLGSAAKAIDFAAVPTMQNSIIDCQALCQRTTTCYSYSWEEKVGGGFECTLYSTWIGRTPGAVVEGETGVWFSDEHVGDGTVWCYSNTPFMGSGLPGGPIIIT